MYGVSERVDRTVKIESSTVEIEEHGMKLLVVVVVVVVVVVEL